MPQARGPGQPTRPRAEVLAHPGVRDFFQALTDRLWREGTGSANRVARAHRAARAALLDKGEMTDKGSINQRAVLTHRAAIVEAVYRTRPGDRGGVEVIVPRRLPA